MQPDDFWQLIANHVQFEDGEVLTDGIVHALVERGSEGISAYDAVFKDCMRRSFSWSLWGAAYLISGGCGDDGFEYFRGWLVAQGRTTFENALTDPDSLADLAELDMPEAEDMLYVASEASEQAGIADFDGADYNYPELGEGWDFDDAAEMQRRYPRLSAKYA